VWLSEITSAKGYYLRSFESVFARYLPLSVGSGRQVVRNPGNQGKAENFETSGTQQHPAPRIEKPMSPEGTPATPMVWLQTSDRRWLGIAARWLAEKGTPLRAVVSVHGAGAYIPAHWLAGWRLTIADLPGS
jgi:hypothetical protein